MNRKAIIKWACEVYGENAKWEGAALERLERFANLVAEHVIKDAPDYKMGYADGVAVERKTIAQMVKPLDESLADEILARSQQ